MSLNESIIISGIKSLFRTDNWKDIIEILMFYKNRLVMVHNDMLHGYKLACFKRVASFVIIDNTKRNEHIILYAIQWSIIDIFPNILQHNGVDCVPNDIDFKQVIKRMTELETCKSLSDMRYEFNLTTISPDAIALLIYYISTREGVIIDNSTITIKLSLIK